MSCNPKPFPPLPFLVKSSGDRGTQPPSGDASHGETIQPSFSRATEPPANPGSQAAHLGQEWGTRQQSPRYDYQHATYRVEYDESQQAKPQLGLLMVDSEGKDYSMGRLTLTQGITGGGLWIDRRIYVIERKPNNPLSSRNWEVVYWKAVG